MTSGKKLKYLSVQDDGAEAISLVEPAACAETAMPMHRRSNGREPNPAEAAFTASRARQVSLRSG
jgi:hypothetical protein